MKMDPAQRIDGRLPEQPRPLKITPGFLPTAEGSALIETGHTKVICTASVEATVPHFKRGSGQGWVTAEYSMLPRSTSTRTAREVSRGRPSGRTSEIQRLIGRALRASIDFKKLGERSILIDCDVLQADGGTRTAAVTGAWVALAVAVKRMQEAGMLAETPLVSQLAAVSVGVVGGVPMLDLCYEEDSRADVDMNVVMTAEGEFVELQATAEQRSFPAKDLDEMLRLAKSGIAPLLEAQQAALEGA
jgi:ribonuclease PH